MPRLPLSLLHPRHWLVWLGVLLLSLFCLVPYRVRDSVAAAVANKCYRPQSKQIRIARANLELCFPNWTSDELESFLQRYFERYFQVLAQAPSVWWGWQGYIKEHSEIAGLENLTAARATEQPIVLLFIHNMAIDHGAVAISMRYPACGIYKQFNNAVIDWLFQRARTRYGGRISERSNELRAMISSLKSGQMMIYLCDEDFGPDRSVFAPFFNHPKATLNMLPRIVRLCQALVVPVVSHYDLSNAKMVTTVLPALEDYPSKDDIENATQLNQTHQQMVQLCPEQYLWKLRIFRTSPDAGKSVYSK